MNVPKPVPYSTIPVGGVFSSDLTQFDMSLGSGNYVNLATGVTGTGLNPGDPFYYFAGATLVLSQ